jgi:glycosyltransferase involved in cell wall biosynthesis
MTYPAARKRPHIAVITPTYNEEASLPDYEDRVKKVLLSNPEYDFTVLLVDDGSKDATWRLICEMHARDSRFSGMRLSRNFGSHVALSAAIATTSGDALATLACDLQDPPETVLEFARKWSEGAQIVWGKRAERDDAFLRVVTSAFFYRILKRFAMPPGSKFSTGSFFLIDHKVAQCFREFQETHRIAFALVAWTGFDQAVVSYNRKKRERGKSGWNYSKMVQTMFDAVLGFSSLPTRIITGAGFAAFTLAIGIICYLATNYMLKRPVPGWTSSMLTLSLFFGIQFLILGIMGEYLHRIYFEVTRRPLYFISDRIGAAPSTCPAPRT